MKLARPPSLRPSTGLGLGPGVQSRGQLGESRVRRAESQNCRRIPSHWQPEAHGPSRSGLQAYVAQVDFLRVLPVFRRRSGGHSAAGPRRAACQAESGPLLPVRRLAPPVRWARAGALLQLTQVTHQFWARRNETLKGRAVLT